MKVSFLQTDLTNAQFHLKAVKQIFK